MFEDGGSTSTFDDLVNEDRKPAKRPRGAYYKNIERKMLLKKKRANVSSIFFANYLPLH